MTEENAIALADWMGFISDCGLLVLRHWIRGSGRRVLVGWRPSSVSLTGSVPGSDDGGIGSVIPIV